MILFPLTSGKAHKKIRKKIKFILTVTVCNSDRVSVSARILVYIGFKGKRKKKSGGYYKWID